MTSPERRAALQEYLLQLRDLLRLQAWDLEVVPFDADENAVLDIKPDPRLYWARVRVGTFFRDDGPEGEIRNTPDEQRRTALHELLHLVQADLFYWLDSGTWQHGLAAADVEMFRERVLHDIEKAADFSARALAPFFPLPPEWPDG